ncbi:MAG TPA: hypothetical protein VLY04_12070 [Bryobacteraceae bacterium]|nr:hypothetical protein [Bryobacteraceae bacterium]
MTRLSPCSYPAANPLVGAVPQSYRLASLANSLEDKALELEAAGARYHGAAHVDDVCGTTPLIGEIEARVAAAYNWDSLDKALLR